MYGKFLLTHGHLFIMFPQIPILNSKNSATEYIAHKESRILLFYILIEIIQPITAKTLPPKIKPKFVPNTTQCIHWMLMPKLYPPSTLMCTSKHRSLMPKLYHQRLNPNLYPTPASVSAERSHQNCTTEHSYRNFTTQDSTQICTKHHPV